jgi:hypothetical protein
MGQQPIIQSFSCMPPSEPQISAPYSIWGMDKGAVSSPVPQTESQPVAIRLKLVVRPLFIPQPVCLDVTLCTGGHRRSGVLEFWQRWVPVCFISFPLYSPICTAACSSRTQSRRRPKDLIISQQIRCFVTPVVHKKGLLPYHSLSI